MQGRIDETSKNRKLNTVIKFDDVTGENTQEQNLTWMRILDQPNRMLIGRGPVSGKTNALLNLIIHPSGSDKMFLYTKDPRELKCLFLIKNV